MQVRVCQKGAIYILYYEMLYNFSSLKKTQSQTRALQTPATLSAMSGCALWAGAVARSRYREVRSPLVLCFFWTGRPGGARPSTSARPRPHIRWRAGSNFPVAPRCLRGIKNPFVDSDGVLREELSSGPAPWLSQATGFCVATQRAHFTFHY